MSRGNKIPFPRGRSAAQGTTIDSGDLQGVHLEGQIVYLPDTDPSDTKVRRSQTDVVARVVRNASGISLLPKRIVQYQAAYWGKRVDGYIKATTTPVAGVVDDHLPSTGVQNNDLFYLIVGGPCLVKTTNTTIVASTQGNPWIGAVTSGASTADVSGSHDSGGITGFAETSNVTFATHWLRNKIGVGLSAKVAANTNQDVLVSIDLL